MIEIWQADAQGRYANPRGSRRAAEHHVQGLRPLGHRQGRRLQLRHRQAGRGRRARTASRRRRISWSASSRAACCGRSIRRIYFDDEAANATDPVLDSRAGRSPRDADRPQAGGTTGAVPLRHPRAGRQRDGVSSTSRGVLVATMASGERWPPYAHYCPLTGHFCPPARAAALIHRPLKLPLLLAFSTVGLPTASAQLSQPFCG